MTGLPVIASKVGDLEDLIIDGTNGYLVNINNSERFSKLIIRLLGDETALANLTQGCYATSKFYEFSSVVQRWDMIFENMGFSQECKND